MAKTRRNNGEGSFCYDKNSKKWRLYYKYTDTDGEAKRKTFYGKTKKELSDRLEAFKASLETESGETSSYARMTLNEFMDIWLSDEKRKLKPRSYERKSETCKMQLAPFLGDKVVKTICFRDVQALINRLDDMGYSYSTIKKTKETILSCLKRFSNESGIKLDPIVDLTMPKQKKKGVGDINYFTDRQLQIFFEEAEKRYTTGARVYGYVAFYVLLYTGMRLGEILALNWDDIDFEKKRIRINKNVVDVKNDIDGTIEPLIQNSTKTARSTRIIPLTQKAEEAFLRIRETSTTDYVFANEAGKYVLHQHVARSFKRIMKNSGLIESGCACTPHSFRHTFATILFRNGCEAKTISDILGHSGVRITCDVYVHVMDEVKAEAMEGIDKYFGGSMI